MFLIFGRGITPVSTVFPTFLSVFNRFPDFCSDFGDCKTRHLLSNFCNEFFKSYSLHLPRLSQYVSNEMFSNM